VASPSWSFASVVIGSGSLSFELIRALVERLPVMICPRWVSTLAQPIGIDDVLAYLAAALRLPDNGSRTFEIGVADQASYQTAVFEPTGLFGLVYWYGLLPAHAAIFGGMLRKIAQRARSGRE